MTWSSVGRHGLHLILAAVFISLLLGCSHDNSLEPTTDFPPADINSFPNTVGTWWTYSIHDYLSGETSSLKITVIKDTSLTWQIYPGIDSFITEYGTVWEYKYDDTVYHYPVIINHDTVKQYYRLSVPLCDRYVFPLEMGQRWRNSTYSVYQDDSVVVTSKMMYSNSQGMSSPAFTLRRYINGTNLNPPSSGTITYQFVPGIGIVRAETDILSSPADQSGWGRYVYTVRQLVSYHIEK